MSISAAKLTSNTTPPPQRKRTLWSDAVRSFLKNRLATAGLIVVLLFIFVAMAYQPRSYLQEDAAAEERLAV